MPEAQPNQTHRQSGDTQAQTTAQLSGAEALAGFCAHAERTAALRGENAFFCASMPDSSKPTVIVSSQFIAGEGTEALNATVQFEVTFERLPKFDKPKWDELTEKGSGGKPTRVTVTFNDNTEHSPLILLEQGKLTQAARELPGKTYNMTQWMFRTLVQAFRLPDMDTNPEQVRTLAQNLAEQFAKQPINPDAINALFAAADPLEVRALVICGGKPHLDRSVLAILQDLNREPGDKLRPALDRVIAQLPM